MPQGVPFNELVAGRLRKLFADPPVAAASLAAGRTVGGLELRRALFAPNAAAGDASIYVAVLAPLPTGMPAANPRYRLQSDALILLQLRHAQDAPFLAALVRSGLLQVLAHIVALAADTPLAVFRRAQALDLLHRVTAEPSFCWFDTPADVAAGLPESASRGQRRLAYDSAASLHSCLLALAPPHPFLPSLLALRHADEAGVSHGALQLVAFWLSWARRCHTKDGVLHLSSAVLRALREWAELPEDAVPPPLVEAGAGGEPTESKASDDDDNDDDTEQDAAGNKSVDHSQTGTGAPGTDDETALARRLWEDFARFDTAEAKAEAAATGSGSAGDAGVSGLTTSVQAVPWAKLPAAADAPAVHDWMVSAADCKAKGNAAYGSGRSMVAAAWYRAAVSILDAGMSDAEAPLEQEELLCDSLSNLAAALLKAGEGGGSASAEPAAEGLRKDPDVPSGEAAGPGSGLWGEAARAADDLPLPSAWGDLLALAEEACTRALRVSAGHVKALGRRARARRALGGRARLAGGEEDAVTALAVLEGTSMAGSGAVGAAAARSNGRGTASKRRAQVAELRALAAQLRKELDDVAAAERAELLEGRARRIFELMAPPDVRPAAPQIDAVSSLRAEGPRARPAAGIHAQMELAAGPLDGMDELLAAHASQSTRKGGVKPETAVLGGSLRVRQQTGSKKNKKGKTKKTASASSLTASLLSGPAIALELEMQ
jgi:hypothetical protein